MSEKIYKYPVAVVSSNQFMPEYFAYQALRGRGYPFGATDVTEFVDKSDDLKDSIAEGYAEALAIYARYNGDTDANSESPDIQEMSNEVRTLLDIPPENYLLGTSPFEATELEPILKAAISGVYMPVEVLVCPDETPDLLITTPTEAARNAILEAIVGWEQQPSTYQLGWLDHPDNAIKDNLLDITNGPLAMAIAHYNIYVQTDPNELTITEMLRVGKRASEFIARSLLFELITNHPQGVAPMQSSDLDAISSQLIEYHNFTAALDRHRIEPVSIYELRKIIRQTMNYVLDTEKLLPYNLKPSAN